MPYESLVEKIRSDKVFKETPIYGRVKSKDEVEFDRLTNEYKEEKEQYEKAIAQYDAESNDYKEIKRELENKKSLIFDNTFEKEDIELDLKEIEVKLEKVAKAKTEKDSEWKKKEEAKESEEGKWKGWKDLSAQKKEWDEKNNQWEEAEDEKRNQLTEEIQKIVDNSLAEYGPNDYYFSDRFKLGRHAQRALEQAIKLHVNHEDFPYIPDYAKIFVEDPVMDFEELATGAGGEEKNITWEYETAKRNYAALKNIFSHKEPQKETGFLDAVYTKLKLIMDVEAINKQKTTDKANRNKNANPFANPFFSDRGYSYALADDATLVEHANQLINLYELAEHADDFIGMLPNVAETDTKGSIEKAEIKERMDMLKSQKGFLRDEIMRLEALSNPYAPYFDLTNLKTVKALSDFYEAGDDEKKKNTDFWALCENCHNRWEHRATVEVEAAESLLTECIDNEKVADTERSNMRIMLVVMEGNQQVGEEKIYTREAAKEALLAATDKQTVQMFFRRTDEDGQQEKIALDLKNDGEMAWATYKTQIDCDCSSLDPATLPQKPRWAKRLWHKIVKLFSKTGVAEVEEYEKAKAKLKEATRNAKEHMEKIKASHLTVNGEVKEDIFNIDNDFWDADAQSIQDLLKLDENEQKELKKLKKERKERRDLWEKIIELEKGENIQFKKDVWDKMTEQQQKVEKEFAERYFALKKKWDMASESDRQKSRITALRSSKMLERRAVKKVEERAKKREEIKTRVQAAAKEYTTGLFKKKDTFAVFDEKSRDILVGKSAGGVDCTRMDYYELTKAINEIQEKLNEFKEKSGGWKSDDEIMIVAEKALDKNNNESEGRNYFDGKSELEVFDGLRNENKELKDESNTAREKAAKIETKRKLALAKTILLRAEERIAELEKLKEPAEKKLCEKILRKKEVSAQDIRKAIDSVIEKRIDEICNNDDNYPSNALKRYNNLLSDKKTLADNYWMLRYGLSGRDGNNNPIKQEGIMDTLKKLKDLSGEDINTKLMPEIRTQIQKKKDAEGLKAMCEKHEELKNNPNYKDIFENPLDEKRLSQKLAKEKANAAKNSVKA